MAMIVPRAGLVLGGVGQDDAAGGDVLRFVAFDDDFVAEGLQRDLALLLGGGAAMGVVLRNVNGN